MAKREGIKKLLNDEQEPLDAVRTDKETVLTNHTIRYTQVSIQALRTCRSKTHKLKRPPRILRKNVKADVDRPRLRISNSPPQRLQELAIPGQNLYLGPYTRWAWNAVTRSRTGMIVNNPARDADISETIFLCCFHQRLALAHSWLDPGTKVSGNATCTSLTLKTSAPARANRSPPPPYMRHNYDDEDVSYTFITQDIVLELRAEIEHHIKIAARAELPSRLWFVSGTLMGVTMALLLVRFR
ncbi:hypothetical protein MVEN_00090500 [Mycena venus]|uniref:Uncharacterized protein n=1 Tax=Mycena venus TaxID=2733690 RepID=A0A8H6Z498_9AGAR|nr:hypothetical protein MVEN_00090500 [Mycena venus]